MHHEPIIVAGEELWLLAERAIYWPKERTLLIADLHLGKAASFRAAGIPIPHGTTTESLARLTACINEYSPRRVIFLGDFLHSAKGRVATTFEAMAEWRYRHRSLELILVRGNHDGHAGDPPADWRIRCVSEPFVIEPFALCHHPDFDTSGYILAGHLHPAVRLQGRRGDQLTLRCFWFGKAIGVLPSFGEFTGSFVVSPQRHDQIFVIGENTVIPLLVDRPNKFSG